MVTKGRAVVDTPLEDLSVIRLPLASPVTMRSRAGVAEMSGFQGAKHRGEGPRPRLLRITGREGRRSPHPFIARIPFPGALLLPLLIAPLLCLLLGTAPLPVVALFLIHLALVIYGALVWGGLVDV
jgi:hypothetical protein